MTSLERRREGRYQRRKAARERKKMERYAGCDRLENIARYGYYTEVNGVAWLYIQVTYQGVKYTGFSSGAYLSKI